MLRFIRETRVAFSLGEYRPSWPVLMVMSGLSPFHAKDAFQNERPQLAPGDLVPILDGGECALTAGRVVSMFPHVLHTAPVSPAAVGRLRISVRVGSALRRSTVCKATHSPASAVAPTRGWDRAQVEWVATPGNRHRPAREVEDEQLREENIGSQGKLCKCPASSPPPGL